jgi:ABC-type branched-subunit amino acid transport system substrate-binding protein
MSISRHRRPRRALAVAALAALLLVAAACTPAPRPGDLSELTAGGPPARDGTTTTQPGAGTAASTPDAAASAGDAGRPRRREPNTVSAAPSDSTDTTTAAPGPDGAPAPYRSTLFTPEEDTVGITDDEITLCVHAALTYGAAFDTGADDLNVYWQSVNESGGVYGRRVQTYYENDNYTPDQAVTAATACKSRYDPFMLIGGIGFDQIPAVRVWAENNRMLYFHHTATEKGTEGLQFSFTGLPTTEKTGEMFAELAITRFPGKKVGIVKRGSENWEPGVAGFKALAAQHNVEIVLEREVQVNKGNYLQDIIDLRNAGAELVWTWLNALESLEFIKQLKAQDWHPQLMVFPFNLTSQNLGADALNPPLAGIAMFNAFSRGDYSGEFAHYADDMQQFEAQYAEYRPRANLDGVGGDLLFLNWSAQKAMHQLLLDCGPDCTRNRFLEVVHGFKRRTNSSACELDFSRPGAGNDHRGGWQLSVMEAYQAPGGDVNFRNTHTCVEHLL